jgi:hypothetical protein
LAKIKEQYKQNPLEVLRAHPSEAITSCSKNIRWALSRFVKLPHLHIAAVETSDLNQMFDNISAYSLLPRDALHLAVIQRMGLTDLVTDDRDFDRVSWLQRHWVFNPPTHIQ